MKVLKKQLIALMLITCLCFSEFATIISCSLDTEGEIETETVLFANDYKSKLYENYYSGKQNEFKYTLEHEIEFSKSKKASEIELNEKPDVFLLGNREISLEPYVYYNFVLVSVKSFNALFGESGKLEFYNMDNELIGEIVADINKPDDEFYIYNFVEEYSQIKYVATKPIYSGVLEMKVQKAIKPEIVQDIAYEDFRNIKQIKNNINLSYVKEEIAEDDEENIEKKVVKEENLEKVLDLKEPITKAELSLSTNTLNALEENKVNFTITLKNSYYENELFENPTVEIELPEEVESINIDRIMLLYKNGLNLSKWYVKEENNKKYLEVELKGKQETYQNSQIIDGTDIVLSTTIKVKDTTSIKKSELKFKYTNSNKEIKYSDGLDYDSYEIELVSKYGLLVMSEIKDTTNEENKVLTIGDITKNLKIDMNSEAKALDFNMTLVNNYTESLRNVEIIGSFPLENNEKLEEKEIKNTYSMSILKAIETLGVENKVYYSSEINPESDSESWTENIEELEQVGSYKIELGNLEPEQYLKFNYQAETPEDLGYNQASYSYYEVNYDYQGQRLTTTSQIGAETERKQVTYEDCQVKEETDLLNIGIYSSKGGKALEDGKEVHEGQIIDYAIVLVNNTDETIENVSVDTGLNNGNYYELKKYYAVEGDESTIYYIFEEDEEKSGDTINIETIEPHETALIQYSSVIRNKNQNDEQDIYSNVKVKLNEEDLIEKESIKNSIKNSRMNAIIAYSNNEADEVSNEELVCTALYVNNKTDETIDRIEFDLEFSAEIELEEILMNLGEKEIEYEIIEQNVVNGKTRIRLMWNQIESGDSKLAIPFKILNYDESKVRDEVSVTGSYVFEDEEYSINNYRKEIYKKAGEVTGEFSSNLDVETLNNGDEISYTFTVTNIGLMPIFANIGIMSDCGLDIEKYETIKDGEIIDSQEDMDSNFTSTMLNLDINESVQINAYAKYNEDLVPLDVADVGIEGVVYSFNLNGTYYSDKITYLLNREDVLENEKDDQEEKYREEYKEEIEEYLKQYKDDPETLEEAEKYFETFFGAQNTYKDNSSDNQQENNNVKESGQNESNIKQNNEDSIKTVKIEEHNNLINVIDEAEEVLETYSDTQASNKNIYKIGGQVWLDSNKNGFIDNCESSVEKVSIKLYKTSGELKQLNDYINLTMTLESGNYCFENLEKGKYMVVFEYDNNLYDITLYNQHSDNFENSSAVLKEINGNKVAVTNVIDLENSSRTDINLGLCEKEKFDLNINKNISSVTVKNEKENRTTTYSGEKLIKEEIDSKYLDGTEVIVNYNIEVSNEGNIFGYANDIIEYLPEGFVFDKKNNKDWYIDNNVLHNTSLSNIELKPGEKKNLNLVLTKTMNEENLGTFKSESEIKVSSNSSNIEDSEISNNCDEVTLILNVKKGKILIYTLLITSNLTIIGIGVWIIKRKVI